MQGIIKNALEIYITLGKFKGMPEFSSKAIK